MGVSTILFWLNMPKKNAFIATNVDILKGLSRSHQLTFRRLRTLISIVESCIALCEVIFSCMDGILMVGSEYRCGVAGAASKHDGQRRWPNMNKTGSMNFLFCEDKPSRQNKYDPSVHNESHVGKIQHGVYSTIKYHIAGALRWHQNMKLSWFRTE